MVNKIQQLMRRFIKHRELGWEEIGEKFTRFTLLKTPWFRVYLHQLNAPGWHPDCHDHPWAFVTLLLWRGYLERIGNTDFRRYPGQILYRPAEFSHNVITPYGTSWSLVITGPTVRKWGFKSCEV
jgi:hypothetical protein